MSISPGGMRSILVIATRGHGPCPRADGALHPHLLSSDAVRLLCEVSRTPERLAPISGKAKTALFTTGSQAAQNAIKIDRQTWSD